VLDEGCVFPVAVVVVVAAIVVVVAEGANPIGALHSKVNNSVVVTEIC